MYIIIILTFLPRETPGKSLSTMNPVNALLAGHFGFGSDLASTKYLDKNSAKIRTSQDIVKFYSYSF